MDFLSAARSAVGSPGILRAFFSLSRAERRLAARCCWLLARAAVLTRLRPIDRIASRIDARASRVGARPAVEALRAIDLLEATAGRLHPRPRCLSQAIAGYELLRERGVAVRCVIGGRRGAPGFEAHAWLEAGGRVVLGAPVTAYRAIWKWPA